MVAKPKESDSRAEGDQEKQQKGVPGPHVKRKHGRRHWDHLPVLKRKQIRSYKSPGRK